MDLFNLLDRLRATRRLRHWATALSALMILTAFPWPALAQAPMLPMQPNLTQVLETESLSVPSDLGYIQAVHTPEAQKPDSVVFLIQDLHTHPEAQHKTSAIINDLHQRFGTGIVAVEGSSGPSLTRLYADFPGKQKVETVSGFMVDEGLFAGADHFAINNPQGVILQGIEDDALYRKHVSVYRLASRLQPTLKPLAAAVTDSVKTLQAQIYPQSLLRMLKARDRYETVPTTESLFDFYSEMRSIAERHRLDLEVYPNLNLFEKMRALDQTLDRTKLEEQAKTLARWLRRHRNPDIRVAFGRIARDLENGRLSSMEFYSRAFELARFGGGDLQNLDMMARYVAYGKLSNEMVPDRLPQEVRSLFERIESASLETPKQKWIAEWLPRFELIRELVSLKLTPQHYDDWIKTYPNLDSDALWQSVRKAGLTQVMDRQQAEDLIEGLPLFNQFYELAHQRDEILALNTLRQINQSGAESGILVAGGFHAPGISQFLQKHNVGVVVITPRVNGAFDEDRYERRLRGEMPKLAELVERFEGETLALPSGTSPKLMPAMLPIFTKLAEFEPGQAARWAANYAEELAQSGLQVQVDSAGNLIIQALEIPDAPVLQVNNETGAVTFDGDESAASTQPQRKFDPKRIATRALSTAVMVVAGGVLSAFLQPYLGYGAYLTVVGVFFIVPLAVAKRVKSGPTLLQQAPQTAFKLFLVTAALVGLADLNTALTVLQSLLSGSTVLTILAATALVYGVQAFERHYIPGLRRHPALRATLYTVFVAVFVFAITMPMEVMAQDPTQPPPQPTDPPPPQPTDPPPPPQPTQPPPPQPTQPPATNVPNTAVPPTSVPPTSVPPTLVPPTSVPPTQIPPTQVPPTSVPPTSVPPTSVPPTNPPPTATIVILPTNTLIPPTQVPPTLVPPTSVPPTQIPPTQVPPTQVPPTSVPPTNVPPTLVPPSPTVISSSPTAVSSSTPIPPSPTIIASPTAGASPTIDATSTILPTGSPTFIPSNTPGPTVTVDASPTVVATNTEIPATPTVGATATIAATNTLVASPTIQASATAQSSITPQPSVTPQPTVTSQPTPTPQAPINEPPVPGGIIQIPQINLPNLPQPVQDILMPWILYASSTFIWVVSRIDDRLRTYRTAPQISRFLMRHIVGVLVVFVFYNSLLALTGVLFGFQAVSYGFLGNIVASSPSGLLFNSVLYYLGLNIAAMVYRWIRRALPSQKEATPVNGNEVADHLAALYAWDEILEQSEYLSDREIRQIYDQVNSVIVEYPITKKSLTLNLGRSQEVYDKAYALARKTTERITAQLEQPRSGLDNATRSVLVREANRFTYQASMFLEASRITLNVEAKTSVLGGYKSFAWHPLEWLGLYPLVRSGIAWGMQPETERLNREIMGSLTAVMDYSEVALEGLYTESGAQATEDFKGSIQTLLDRFDAGLGDFSLGLEGWWVDRKLLQRSWGLFKSSILVVTLALLLLHPAALSVLPSDLGPLSVLFRTISQDVLQSPYILQVLQVFSALLAAMGLTIFGSRLSMSMGRTDQHYTEELAQIHDQRRRLREKAEQYGAQMPLGQGHSVGSTLHYRHMIDTVRRERKAQNNPDLMEPASDVIVVMASRENYADLRKYLERSSEDNSSPWFELPWVIQIAEEPDSGSVFDAALQTIRTLTTGSGGRVEFRSETLQPERLLDKKDPSAVRGMILMAQDVKAEHLTPHALGLVDRYGDRPIFDVALMHGLTDLMSLQVEGRAGLAVKTPTHATIGPPTISADTEAHRLQLVIDTFTTELSQLDEDIGQINAWLYGEPVPGQEMDDEDRAVLEEQLRTNQEVREGTLRQLNMALEELRVRRSQLQRESANAGINLQTFRAPYTEAQFRPEREQSRKRGFAVTDREKAFGVTKLLWPFLGAEVLSERIERNELTSQIQPDRPHMRHIASVTGDFTLSLDQSGFAAVERLASGISSDMGIDSWDLMQDVMVPLVGGVAPGRYSRAMERKSQREGTPYNKENFRRLYELVQASADRNLLPMIGVQVADDVQVLDAEGTFETDSQELQRIAEQNVLDAEASDWMRSISMVEEALAQQPRGDLRSNQREFERSLTDLEFQMGQHDRDLPTFPVQAIRQWFRERVDNREEVTRDMFFNVIDDLRVAVIEAKRFESDNYLLQRWNIDRRRIAFGLFTWIVGSLIFWTGFLSNSPPGIILAYIGGLFAASVAATAVSAGYLVELGPAKSWFDRFLQRSLQAMGFRKEPSRTNMHWSVRHAYYKGQLGRRIGLEIGMFMSKAFKFFFSKRGLVTMIVGTIAILPMGKVAMFESANWMLAHREQTMQLAALAAAVIYSGLTIMRRNKAQRLKQKTIEEGVVTFDDEDLTSFWMPGRLELRMLRDEFRAFEQSGRDQLTTEEVERMLIRARNILRSYRITKNTLDHDTKNTAAIYHQTLDEVERIVRQLENQLGYADQWSLASGLLRVARTGARFGLAFVFVQFFAPTAGITLQLIGGAVVALLATGFTRLVFRQPISLRKWFGSAEIPQETDLPEFNAERRNQLLHERYRALIGIGKTLAEGLIALGHDQNIKRVGSYRYADDHFSELPIPFLRVSLNRLSRIIYGMEGSIRANLEMFHQAWQRYRNDQATHLYRPSQDGDQSVVNERMAKYREEFEGKLRKKFTKPMASDSRKLKDKWSFRKMVLSRAINWNLHVLNILLVFTAFAVGQTNLAVTAAVAWLLNFTVDVGGSRLALRGRRVDPFAENAMKKFDEMEDRIGGSAGRNRRLQLHYQRNREAHELEMNAWVVLRPLLDRLATLPDQVDIEQDLLPRVRDLGLTLKALNPDVAASAQDETLKVLAHDLEDMIQQVRSREMDAAELLIRAKDRIVDALWIPHQRPQVDRIIAVVPRGHREKLEQYIQEQPRWNFLPIEIIESSQSTKGTQKIAGLAHLEQQPKIEQQRTAVLTFSEELLNNLTATLPVSEIVGEDLNAADLALFEVVSALRAHRVYAESEVLVMENAADIRIGQPVVAARSGLSVATALVPEVQMIEQRLTNLLVDSTRDHQVAKAFYQLGEEAGMDHLRQRAIRRHFSSNEKLPQYHAVAGAWVFNLNGDQFDAFLEWAGALIRLADENGLVLRENRDILVELVMIHQNEDPLSFLEVVFDMKQDLLDHLGATEGPLSEKELELIQELWVLSNDELTQIAAVPLSRDRRESLRRAGAQRMLDLRRRWEAVYKQIAKLNLPVYADVDDLHELYFTRFNTQEAKGPSVSNPMAGSGGGEFNKQLAAFEEAVIRGNLNGAAQSLSPLTGQMINLMPSRFTDDSQWIEALEAYDDRQAELAAASGQYYDPMRSIVDDFANGRLAQRLLTSWTSFIEQLIAAERYAEAAVQMRTLENDLDVLVETARREPESVGWDATDVQLRLLSVNLELGEFIESPRAPQPDLPSAPTGSDLRAIELLRQAS